MRLRSSELWSQLLDVFPQHQIWNFISDQQKSLDSQFKLNLTKRHNLCDAVPINFISVWKDQKFWPKLNSNPIKH